MKRILKILLVFLLVLVLGLVLFGFFTHESLPEGKVGPEADAMAQKMLNALNYEAYKETRFLEWSYQGGRNQYRWDKKLGRCSVTWGEYQVHLNLTAPQKSIVKKKGARLKGEEKEKAIDKALAFFNNDSFWLVAPYKVFDQGTSRSVVDFEDGSKGLLVTYNSGGTTPGDSYLWRLRPDGYPDSYQMWVKIIPIGGLKATWEDWIETESGAVLPKNHTLGPISLSMGDVKAYND